MPDLTSCKVIYIYVDCSSVFTVTTNFLESRVFFFFYYLDIYFLRPSLEHCSTYYLEGSTCEEVTGDIFLSGSPISYTYFRWVSFIFIFLPTGLLLPVYNRCCVGTQITTSSITAVTEG